MNKTTKTFLTVILCLAFISIGGYYLVREADAAAPGDVLFPLDKLTESVTRLAISNPEKKAAFEQQVLDERVAELEQVVGEDGDVEGSIDEIDKQETNLDESLTDDGISASDEAKARIIEKTQEQTAKHVTTMNKVQTQVGNDTAKQNIQEITVNIQERSQERIQKLQDSINE